MAATNLGTATSRATLQTGGGLLSRFDVRAQGRWYPVLSPARGAGPTGASAFPMVPWCNRLSRSGIETGQGFLDVAANWPSSPCPVHGLGWQAKWSIEHRTPRTATLRMRHAAADPYAFECDMVVVLDARSLAVTLVVRNIGTAALPYGLGYHPYVPRHIGTSLQLGAGKVRQMDPRGLPMAKPPMGPPNDLRHHRRITRRAFSASYATSATAELRSPTVPFATQITSKMSTQMVWAPSGSNYICIEPMSHGVDAFGSRETAARHVLEPGASRRLTMIIKRSS